MFNAIRKTTTTSLVGAVLLVPMGVVHAQGTSAEMDIEHIQQQIEALQQQVEALKARQDATGDEVAELEGSVVTRSESGDLQIGNTTLSIGGYIKAQAALSNHGFSNGKASESVSPGSLRRVDEDLGSRASFSARQTRINFGTTTPVAGDRLKSFIEFDFYGADDEANEFVTNSYAPRLRHAYLSWGSWLAGQTYSVFTDLNGLGEIDAFGQHASSNVVRQAQVRYTHTFADGSLQFSLENPEDGDDDQAVPDIVGRVNLDGDWGHASLAALARRLEVDDGIDEDTSWADAYSITARIPTFGKDDIRLQANYGTLGRYMGLRAYPDAQVVDGEIEGIDAWGASALYRHFWTDSLRSTLAYSRTGLDSDASGDTTDSYDTLFVNLYWSPMAKTTLGLEYQRFDLEEVDGDNFDLDRVQASARYDF